MLAQRAVDPLANSYILLQSGYLVMY